MIHQYKMNGYNIVIDGNSGSVHSVDDLAYDVISMYETKKKEEIVEELIEKYSNEGISSKDIEELISDIDQLVEEGMLFSEDPYEIIAKELKNRQSKLKALCLHVAHGCNMDCEYCFAGKGEYNNKAGLMSLETAKAAIDFLIKNSEGRKNLEVDLFGGEPLLNWEVCKKTVEYARSLEGKHKKKFNFTLTTNGLLIDDDVIKFSNEEMGNVVLSMDGRKDIHNRMRHIKKGGDSYEEVIEKFKKFVNARSDKQYYMRGTYTAYNKDFAYDVIHMADMGFNETSIEPVVCDKSEAYALNEDDLPKLYSEYEKLALEMLERKKMGKPFNFYHYSINLNGGPCIYKRVSGCGVGTEYLAVTPTGDIYPCHQFVGDDDFKLGDVYNGITEPKVTKFFENNNIYTRDKCRDCFAKLYCAGGCAANNYHSNQDINKVYEFGCKLQRKRIECAIMMKVAGIEE